MALDIVRDVESPREKHGGSSRGVHYYTTFEAYEGEEARLDAASSSHQLRGDANGTRCGPEGVFHRQSTILYHGSSAGTVHRVSCEENSQKRLGEKTGGRFVMEDGISVSKLRLRGKVLPSD